MALTEKHRFIAQTFVLISLMCCLLHVLSTSTISSSMLDQTSGKIILLSLALVWLVAHVTALLTVSTDFVSEDYYIYPPGMLPLTGAAATTHLISFLPSLPRDFVSSVGFKISLGVVCDIGAMGVFCIGLWTLLGNMMTSLLKVLFCLVCGDTLLCLADTFVGWGICEVVGHFNWEMANRAQRPSVSKERVEAWLNGEDTSEDGFIRLDG